MKREGYKIGDNTNYLVKAVNELEGLEKEYGKLPLTFSEMFKDEIDSNDEERLYNGIKRIIRKYKDDAKAIAVIDEFTRVISGGASLLEIMQISRDETLNPTLASEITVEDSCRLEQ